MPRKVVAWACDFKCGYKVQTVKARMVEHEKNCCHNPKNRACITCGNLSVEHEQDYMGHRMGEATYGPWYKILYCDSLESTIFDDNGHGKFRKKCPAWISKDQQSAKNKTEGDKLLQDQVWREESLKWAPVKQDDTEIFF